jgi:hypothetical protein
VANGKSKTVPINVIRLSLRNVFWIFTQILLS